MGIELFYPTDGAQPQKDKLEISISENDPKSQTIDYPKQGLLSEITSEAIHDDPSSNQIHPNQFTYKDDSIKINQSELINEERIHENESIMSFSLNYYFLSDKLAVLEETTNNGSVFNRKEYLNLLRNIVSALGINVEGQSFNLEGISWPVAGGFSSSTDQKLAAQQMLNGYVRRKFQEAQFANLLIFADTIFDLVTSKKKSDAINDYFKDVDGFHITICQGLREMLARPELKKNVWNSLQPLRKRITSG